MNDDIRMLEVIKNEIERQISESIDEEIEKRTEAFHRELTENKDRFIAEVMNGIRITQEFDPMHMYLDYRIVFINRYIHESAEGKE